MQNERSSYILIYKKEFTFLQVAKKKGEREKQAQNLYCIFDFVSKDK